MVPHPLSLPAAAATPHVTQSLRPLPHPAHAIVTPHAGYMQHNEN